MKLNYKILHKTYVDIKKQMGKKAVGYFGFTLAFRKDKTMTLEKLLEREYREHDRGIIITDFTEYHRQWRKNNPEKLQKYLERQLYKSKEKTKNKCIIKIEKARKYSLSTKST